MFGACRFTTAANAVHTARKILSAEIVCLRIQKFRSCDRSSCEVEVWAAHLLPCGTRLPAALLFQKHFDTAVEKACLAGPGNCPDVVCAKGRGGGRSGQRPRPRHDLSGALSASDVPLCVDIGAQVFVQAVLRRDAKSKCEGLLTDGDGAD
jgi:hypothetical protein